MFRKLLLSLAFLLPLSVFAQTEAPDALVKRVTEEVLAAVRQDKDIQSGNTQKAIALVETKALVTFNPEHMTALAVGRDWSKANEAQKKKITAEFQNLLVRTYSNALTGYKDQTIRYKPFKMQDSDTDVTVRSEVIQAGTKPIPIDYSLEKTPNGWKVYDVTVAGVSLVSNYRTTFNQEVRANGIDGLIQMLVTKNKQLDAPKK